MLEQELTDHKVRTLLKSKDVRKYVLWSDKSQSEQVIRQISARIISKNYQIEFRQFLLFGKKVYTPDNVETEIVTRSIDFLIRRIYKIKQADRERIVRQLRSILRSSNNYEVTRLDFSGFYESVDTDTLLERLATDAILTEETIATIREIVAKTSVAGLPRGVSISATLSELFMRDFDKFARSRPGVIYMARYVDDIILITMPGAKDEIRAIKQLAVQKKLVLNTDKERFLRTSDLSRLDNFDFLGYNLKAHKTTEKQAPRVVDISIAPEKLLRIKRKYSLALAHYLKTGDFRTLHQRVRLLTGNYDLSITKNGILKAGIYFSYKLISENSPSLHLLDRFRKSILNGPSRLSRAVNLKLSSIQSAQLWKYSFTAGFKKRLSHRHSEERLVELHGCWKNA